MKHLVLFLLLLATLKLPGQPLVEIGKDDGILIELRYTTAENFFKTAFYPTNARALLRPATAAKLRKVQDDLKKQGLGLKVWDA